MSLDPADIQSDLALVPNLKMGHLAFPCFKLSKELKKNPKEIADALSSAWQNKEGMTEIKAVGPYLNFFISPQLFGETE